MIFLSIIVPCYRNKDILKMGIPSFERQSIKDFELILIYDKSPNDLYESMEQYVNSDSCSIKDKIRLYRNEINMGPGATRNRGIELTQGKYILFLDDDDYLKDDAVGILKENDSDKDVVLYDFERILGKKIIKGTTYIYYAYEHNYSSEKGYTVPKSTSIGKCTDDDPELMYPNTNFLKFFPTEELPETKGEACRSGCLRRIVNKAFGNNCYAHEMSVYGGTDYQKVSLKESIERIEE